MRMRIGVMLVVGACLTGAPQVVMSQPSPAPLIGTWTFNAVQSRMGLSLPPRNLTRTYTDRGGGVYIFTQEGNGPDGTPAFSIYVARDDGNEYPMYVRGRDEMGVIAIKRIDAHTAEQTETGGGVSTTVTRTVSPDGQTLTLTVQPSGRQVTLGAAAGDVDVLVFDKK